jgi:hypothetical protein
MASAQSIELYLEPCLSAYVPSVVEATLEESDSLSAMTTADVRWNYGFSTIFSMNQSWKFQTGLSLQNYGFERTRSGLEFHDTIHPQVGWIKDLSDNGTKVATYDYRFRTLSVPMLFHYDLSTSYKRAIYQYSLYFGTSFNYVLQEEIDIFLTGFSVNGESDHIVDGTGYAPSKINTNLEFGGRAQIRIDSDFYFSIQPGLRLNLIKSGSDESIKFNLMQLGVRFGINYKL